MKVLKTGVKGFAPDKTFLKGYTKSKIRPSPVTADPYLGNQNLFQQQWFQHQHELLKHQQQQQHSAADTTAANVSVSSTTIFLSSWDCDQLSIAPLTISNGKPNHVNPECSSQQHIYTVKC